MGKSKHIATASLCLLVAASLVALPGCRNTDFLKKVLFGPHAEVVDYEHPVVVNDPDAEETTELLPAYDIRDVTEQSPEFQNIVVYSSNPNTYEATTHHSVFDMSPRFKGVEASDAVRLRYTDNRDALDHEVAAEAERESQAESEASNPDGRQEEEPPADLPSVWSDEGLEEETQQTEGQSEADDQGSGGASKLEEDGASSNGDSDAAGSSGGNSSEGDGWSEIESPDSSGNGDGGSGEGGASGDSNGEAEAGTDGDNGDNQDEKDPGRSARESGGYGGDNITYDPGNDLIDPQKADHVAAIGQAAVIAQAVGGAGAVIAMDENTFYGMDEDGVRASYVSSFADVFSDELADGFETDALLWSGSGMLPTDLKSVNELVKLCADKDTGKGGVIAFDGRFGSQQDYFSSKQLESFEAAGIQLLPIDTSTAQGLLDGFTALGKVLAESDETSESDPFGNSEQYHDVFNGLISAACATHKGKMAAEGAASKRLYGDYREGTSSMEFFNVWGEIATDFEEGATYVPDKGEPFLDASLGVLFADTGYEKSPLSVYMQAGGVMNTSGLDSGAPVRSLYGDVDVVWPFGTVKCLKRNFANYSAGGPMSRIAYSEDNADILDYSRLGANTGFPRSTQFYPHVDTCGSKYFPYLIVSGCARATGEQVKQRLVQSSQTPNSVYYLQHYHQGKVWEEYETNGGGIRKFSSALGEQSDYDGSLFYDKGIDFADCVRVNPSGLIGSWTQGTPESVLESAWIADIYSKYPTNSDYCDMVVCDMTKFNVTIGDVECQSVQEAVEAFYATIYRCPASQGVWSYSDIVTDSGEDLNTP